VAARAEGLEISVDQIAMFVANTAADVLVVEGAGGWRVPITETEDMSALAKILGLPVLVVGRAGLGTINHSLLTVEAVERDGCQVAGLVLSKRPEDDDAFAESNAAEIRAKWSGRVVIYDGRNDTLSCFT
jgi:dethiobiotin synthetase